MADSVKRLLWAFRIPILYMLLIGYIFSIKLERYIVIIFVKHILYALLMSLLFWRSQQNLSAPKQLKNINLFAITLKGTRIKAQSAYVAPSCGLFLVCRGEKIYSINIKCAVHTISERAF
jgi:hypothetical protein